MAVLRRDVTEPEVAFVLSEAIGTPQVTLARDWQDHILHRIRIIITFRFKALTENGEYLQHLLFKTLELIFVEETALSCQLDKELIDNRILLQVHHRHGGNMQEVALVISLQIIKITFR